MQKIAYCLFDSSLGPCGLAWNEDTAAIVALRFPEATSELTEARIAKLASANTPSSPPPAIARVIEKVSAHLDGELQDFRSVRIDFQLAGEFARQVYAAAQEIPPGKTMTYGELAAAFGRPNAARAVGGALGRNPIGLIVPCHRVLAAGSKPGGFSAPGGVTTKSRLLAIEGAILIGTNQAAL